MPEQQKPIITRRLNVSSIPDIVDGYLERIPKTFVAHYDFSREEDVKRFRGMLTHVAEYLLNCFVHDLSKAAAKGIEEMANLILDPDYYETVKKRRRASREQMERWRREADERQERIERHRRGEYTNEEREQAIEATKQSIDYHDKILRAERDKLLKLESGAALLEDVNIDWGDADF